MNCVQAVSENLSLKQQIFSALAKEVSPQAILASNTSSISITKIAASTIPKDISAASEKGKANASRVVGMKFNHRTRAKKVHEPNTQVSISSTQSQLW